MPSHATRSAAALPARAGGPLRLASWLLLVLGLFVWSPRDASAEVLRLRTGETIKGRVLQDRTNEQVLVVEDFLGGGVREFAWGALVEEDATRVRIQLGLEFVAEAMTCELITYRLDDGSTTTIRGVIEGEEGGYYLVRNRSQKEPFRIRKDRVVHRETTECDPQEIYAPEELTARKRAELNPSDARGWWLFGQYCESVEAYAEAKEAYENAAADDTFLGRKLAQDGAARMDSIIKDAEALETVRALKLALASQMWKRVRDGIEGFASKHPEAGEAVKKKLESLQTDFVAKRAKFFADLAGKRLEPIVRDLIKKKVAPKDVAYNDVQAWLRKQCLEDALDRLLKELQAKDPSVTPEEVKEFFDARPKRATSWKIAKYGSGSFIVEPPKVLPKTGNKPPPKPPSGSGGGPAPSIELPKPPTRDSWWTSSSTDTRADFWWALFVEKSGLYEVHPKKERIACARCTGDGTLTLTLSSGGQATVLCPRCGGTRFDFGVKYR